VGYEVLDVAGEKMLVLRNYISASIMIAVYEIILVAQSCYMGRQIESERVAILKSIKLRYEVQSRHPVHQ
jgi:hypothetical protein